MVSVQNDTKYSYKYKHLRNLDKTNPVTFAVSLCHLCYFLLNICKKYGESIIEEPDYNFLLESIIISQQYDLKIFKYDVKSCIKCSSKFAL